MLVSKRDAFHVDFHSSPETLMFVDLIVRILTFQSEKFCYWIVFGMEMSPRTILDEERRIRQLYFIKLRRIVRFLFRRFIHFFHSFLSLETVHRIAFIAFCKFCAGATEMAAEHIHIFLGATLYFEEVRKQRLLFFFFLLKKNIAQFLLCSKSQLWRGMIYSSIFYWLDNV